MLLYWNFCIEWFDSNSKEKFKIYLEIPWKNWKKKKENVFFFILGFWPIGLAASCFLPRLLLVGRSASRAVGQRATRLLPPPRLGPSRRRPSSRAQATVPLSSLSLANVAGPRVRAASLLKPSAMTPFKTITDRIPPLNLFFP
jgi:hypothetical protein